MSMDPTGATPGTMNRSPPKAPPPRTFGKGCSAKACPAEERIAAEAARGTRVRRCIPMDYLRLVPEHNRRLKRLGPRVQACSPARPYASLAHAQEPGPNPH